MILVDANLLLYAYNTSAHQHADARKWLEGVLSQPQPVGFSWVTMLAFLRISTNPRAFQNPLSIDEAVEIVSELLSHPTTVTLEPGGQYWNILSNLLTTTGASGPLVMDAHLAALAIEHNATLYTSDGDFSRFPGLRFVNPV